MPQAETGADASHAGGQGTDAGRIASLLKALARARPPERDDGLGPLARFLRRRREHAVMAQLQRAWTGGFTLHRTGDLVYVPAPLDARGRHCLLHPPRLHPAVTGFLGAGSVALDVGANLGEWTLPLARAVGPAGRVVSFEPNPHIADALRRSLAINNLVHAELDQRAVSDQAGEARLAIPGLTSLDADTGRAHLGDAAIGEDVVTVATTTLDAAVAALALPRIDFVKIDVEGHERRVLDGAAVTLERFRPVVVIETGHEAGEDRRLIADRLERLGYRMLGVLLDFGACAADWPAYRQASAPFRAGQPHNLLLVPDRR